MYLYEIAKILRSKNSGPFQITLDILFDKPEDYSLVADSGVLTKERICSFYQRQIVKDFLIEFTKIYKKGARSTVWLLTPRLIDYIFPFSRSLQRYA